MTNVAPDHRRAGSYLGREILEVRQGVMSVLKCEETYQVAASSCCCSDLSVEECLYD